ncbi:NB-ARC domain-containing protein [Nodularia sp. UHCC 0506]|uniref:WD40 domain-containing protein n=1 Tax=Nodularia sp. UHCC 0506 TaxID=3110243 RepID=UPI002B1F6335|nr:NB-ARC domain-containing protein [Nodularia sp. UHCC 0506]MEA5515388.1 NB-ARC domain-containing protein [Nodularia sp. UHCC 0506]
MDIQQALVFVDTLIFEKTGKHLSDLQRRLLHSFWSDPHLRYHDIAETYGYSVNYLKQDIGPKLWQLLSEGCGEKVSKTNFRSALERKWQQADITPVFENNLPLTTFTQQVIPRQELSSPDVINTPLNEMKTYQDWGDAPDVSVFYSRTQELATLEQWIVGDGCRLVVLLGMGGIGKTHLSVKLAEQIQHHFDYLIWRSLVSAPPLQQLTRDILNFLNQGEENNLPIRLEEQISTLMQILKTKRCLLILDNTETILKSGVLAGQYQKGYENYRTFFQALGQRQHNSCLLLTTREKPQEISFMQGETLPVRCLKLAGLTMQAGQQLLQVKGCFLESELCLQKFIEKYSGNPLALKIISAIAQDLYNGNISELLKSKLFIPGEINEVLEQQFNRLPVSEKNFLYWLTLEQEQFDESALKVGELPEISPQNISETIRSLLHRSLLEKKNKKFFLQPVVREYLQNKIIDEILEEIESENILLLNQYPLLKSEAKEYVRQGQIQLFIQPLADRLLTLYKSRNKIEIKFQNILVNLRENTSLEPGYAVGNIINLLCKLQIELTGYDFSDLTVWSSCLQKINLQNVNFTRADLSKSVFAKQLTSILSLAFSHNGKLLATGDVNGEIHLWQIDNGQAVLRCKGHAGWVHSISFSPDGKMLCSASSDHTVKLWDVFDGSCLKTLTGHHQRVRSVAFSPDGKIIASGSSDATIRFWYTNSGECFQVLSGHENFVWSVAFSPDGRMIASGSEDKSIKLWDVNTGECLQTLLGHNRWVRAIAFSSDGKLLASGSGDRTLKIWETSTGKCLQTFTGHTQRLRSVAFSPDGKLVASGSGDHTVRLWSIADGQCLKNLHGHNSLLTSVTFSPNGTILATAGEDRSVRLWEVSTGSCIDIWQGYGSWVQSVAFSPDGKTLASGSEDKSVRLWNLETTQSLNTPPHSMVLEGHRGWVCSVAFSPDGKHLASGSSDYSIKLWDVNTGQCLKTFQGHSRWIGSVAFSPNGLTLASCSGDYTVKLWDIITGNCLKTLQGHEGWLWSVQFSPDGVTLASASEDKTIKLWDITTGNCINTLVGHTSWVQGIFFSPDGKLLASASCDCTIRLWNVATGECLTTLRGHSSWVQSVAFSPNGEILASGSCDQTVKLWNLNTGKCQITIPAHQSWVWSVAFSPDGQILVSGGQDETMRLWDIHTGNCLQTLRTKRPYEGMCIQGAKGITDVQREALKFLGAVD